MGTTRTLRCLLIALFAAAADYLGAQENDTARSERRRNRIGLGGDVMHIANRDEAGSPLVYEGTGWPLRIFYRHDGEENRHWVSIGYIKTGINGPALRSSATHDTVAGGASFMSHTADYSWRSLQYGYSRAIGSILDERVSISLGGVWDNLLFFRYYTYGYRESNERDPSLLSWDGVFTLSASLGGDIAIDERQSAHLSLSTPFLAYVVRPRYAVQDDELIKISLDNFSRLNTGRGRFMTIGEIVQFGGRATYLYSLSSLFDLQLIYSVLYYRYTHPHPTTTASSSFGASLMYKF